MINTLRRWHFYAGLLCIPFVIVLAVSGALYLFNPQIEAQLDRGYDNLTISGPAASASQQVAAALASVPGSVLNAYVLPETPHTAVRVLVGNGEALYRVYLHPQTRAVLDVAIEDNRPMRIVHRLHGQLLMGDRGSMLVELMASWAIVLFLTGIFLWWPRGARGPAGLAYPRIRKGQRIFWRDLHAVTGIWICLFTLFLLISGLPWAKSWGSMLKELRQWNAPMALHQDWTTGRASELAERREMNSQGATVAGEHSDHAAHGGAPSDGTPASSRYEAIDRLVAAVAPLRLAAPVQIAPPSQRSSHWTARSLAQNRPLRADLTLDARTGAILTRTDFSQRPLLDRVIGIAVAIHEGQLFGWANQALGVFTALGLVLMCVSAVVLWWSRRPPGVLGTPIAGLQAQRISFAVGACIVLIAILLPLLGLSLVLTLVLERLVLRRFATTRIFLGLPDSVPR